MGNKIRGLFYTTNFFVRALALIGVLIAFLAWLGIGALSSIVGIYTYVMYVAAGFFALVSVAMIIRTILKFRLIGLIRAIFYMALTALLFLMYAHFTGIFVLF